jgi:hypothetical protein
MKLTTYLHLMPRSRMHGAITPLPQYVFMALCLVKHRDFNIYLTGGNEENYETSIRTADTPISSVVLTFNNILQIISTVLISHASAVLTARPQRYASGPRAVKLG